MHICLVLAYPVHARVHACDICAYMHMSMHFRCLCFICIYICNYWITNVLARHMTSHLTQIHHSEGTTYIVMRVDAKSDPPKDSQASKE